ncbi:MAG: thiamine-phosphate kinase [Bacteroidetes bacterium]|nr:thiamine-phosphate kinase [Bacteroidota bacterium]
MSQTFTPVESIGEFGLIDRIVDRLPDEINDDSVVCGIGDDAAVYRATENALQVITTDALIEGVHFDRSFVPLVYLGEKAIAVNASDIAAMNARPRVATVALGVPRNMSVEMVESLYDGIALACRSYGVELVGGDTSSSQALYIAVSMTGDVPDDRVVFRRGARPGEVLCVTGDLGGAFAGLKVLLDQRRGLEEMGEDFEPELDAYRYVIDRQLRPTARLDFIGVLGEFAIRPSSMIDISDGLVSEIHHICRQSDVGATLQIPSLPFHPETRAVADQFLEDVDTYALYGGEDYELLFTVSSEDASRLESAGHCAVIGTVEEADVGINAFNPETGLIPLNAAGFRHFAEAQNDDDQLRESSTPDDS